MFPWLSCCTFAEVASAQRAGGNGAEVQRQLLDLRGYLRVADDRIFGVDLVDGFRDFNRIRAPLERQADVHAQALPGGKLGVYRGRTPESFSGCRDLVSAWFQIFDQKSTVVSADYPAIAVFFDAVDGNSCGRQWQSTGIARDSAYVAKGRLRQ